MTDFERKIRRYEAGAGPLTYLIFGDMAAKAYAGDGSCRDFAGRPVARSVCWREFVLEYGPGGTAVIKRCAPWGFLSAAPGDWDMSVIGFLSRPDLQYYSMWAGGQGLIIRPGLWERFSLWRGLRPGHVILDGIFD